jgi:gas vesicle protein
MARLITVATAFASGIAAGVTIGYLTAPRSGEATRKQLVATAERGRERVQEAVEGGMEQVKSLPPAMVAASNAATEAFKERIGEPAKANGARK